jgi:hypothetical protein
VNTRPENHHVPASRWADDGRDVAMIEILLEGTDSTVTRCRNEPIESMFASSGRNGRGRYLTGALVWTVCGEKLTSTDQTSFFGYLK